VACIYDNWQSIFYDPPNAINAQHPIDRSPADCDQELQYSLDEAERAGANILSGTERGTLADSPASHP